MDDEYNAWSGMDPNWANDEYTAWSGMKPGWDIDFVETMPDEVYTPSPSSYGTGAGLPGEEAANQSQGGTGGTGNVIPTTPAPSSGLGGFLKGLLVDAAGKPNPIGLLGAMALLTAMNRGSGAMAPKGYQGGVPRYTAVRPQISYAQDAERRPG
ncbi:MAG: hypothetical protein EBS01_15800, partial [Verrucomicrobia bacterium]|nr:hypothetical protein [Verrucomicrobiota bacterium]